MSANIPSRLTNLKELLRIVEINTQIQVEISTILEDYQIRLYSLEEDRKRLLAVNRDYEKRISSLERRYSELLYRLKE